MITGMSMKMTSSMASILGTLFLSVVIPVRAFAQPVPAGNIAAIAGNASIVRQGASVEPETGAPVYGDDAITTGNTGKMRILFVDNSVISIGPNARINIDRYVSTPSKRSVLLSMVRGKARFLISKISNILNTYDIHTVTAIIGIRGTDFVIDASDGQKTAVYVINGSVNLQNIKQGALNPVMITTGKMSTVRAGRSPSLPENYSPAVLQQLLNEIILQFNKNIINRPVPYDSARASLARLIEMVTKNKPGNVSISEELPVKKTELPSHQVLRTYRQSISPVLPLED